MTSNSSTPERRTSVVRVLAAGTGAALCAAVLTVDVWLVATAFVREGLSALGGYPVLGYFVFALTALGAGFCLKSVTAGTDRDLLPEGTVALALLALTLLAIGTADGTPDPWFLAPAAATAALTAAVTPGGIRRQQERIDRARRRRDHGTSVRGSITEVTDLSSGDDTTPTMRLTVRYTAADGAEYTGTAAKEFPRYDLPRPGLAVTVRHLPDDPGDIEIEQVHTGDAAALPEQLERLAALHERGSLSDEEYALAKARLLTASE